MPLQAFSFPFPETRFFKAGGFIYKFKIRGGSSYSGDEVVGGSCFSQELEEIIRTVLGNLDHLQPFSSAHFSVFPYKKRWEGVSKAMCNHCERNLRVYPSVLTLYLEKSMANGKQAEQKLSPGEKRAEQSPPVSEPQSKRCKRDSPLEEAILKDLISDLEAECNASTVGTNKPGSLNVYSIMHWSKNLNRLHVDDPCAGGEIKEDPAHIDEKGTAGFDERQQRSGVSAVRGSGPPGEVHPGTTQNMGEEEGEHADPVTPVRPGVLTRLVRHIFPFSLFFREP